MFKAMFLYRILKQAHAKLKADCKILKAVSGKTNVNKGPSEGCCGL